MAGLATLPECLMKPDGPNPDLLETSGRKKKKRKAEKTLGRRHCVNGGQKLDGSGSRQTKMENTRENLPEGPTTGKRILGEISTTRRPRKALYIIHLGGEESSSDSESEQKEYESDMSVIEELTDD
ncbi:unnamed protein product [Plutella xylostella]|uniref:(diamondback moth) hypothetical protein n=1 Tax=Plutella xylostella TaxID=51655 RepID=A0A8S4G633_PLUXY|nr:unnamed protein product [Plutella xylostella]